MTRCQTAAVAAAERRFGNWLAVRQYIAIDQQGGTERYGELEVRKELAAARGVVRRSAAIDAFARNARWHL